MIIYRATGKTAKDLNYSVMHDSDNSVLIRNRETGMTSYLERPASNEAVYTGYCEATGQSYTSVEDAMKKGAVNKVVNVTNDHPEAYREFRKIKTANAFSERGNSWFTDPDPGNAFTGGLQGLSDGSNSRQEDR